MRTWSWRKSCLVCAEKKSSNMLIAFSVPLSQSKKTHPTYRNRLCGSEKRLATVEAPSSRVAYRSGAVASVAERLHRGASYANARALKARAAHGPRLAQPNPAVERAASAGRVTTPPAISERSLCKTSNGNVACRQARSMTIDCSSAKEICELARVDELEWQPARRKAEYATQLVTESKRVNETPACPSVQPPIRPSIISQQARLQSATRRCRKENSLVA